MLVFQKFCVRSEWMILYQYSCKYVNILIAKFLRFFANSKLLIIKIIIIQKDPNKFGDCPFYLIFCSGQSHVCSSFRGASSFVEHILISQNHLEPGMKLC